jgi:hypothetical protein
MGTALKDAETFRILIFLSRSPRVCPWLPDKCPVDTSPSPSVSSITSVILTSCSYLAVQQFIHNLHLHLVHQVLYVVPKKET